jgi:hypothetical protein
MAKTKRYSPEVRDRAVRMVFDHASEYRSQWEATRSIASKIELIRAVGAVSPAKSAYASKS